MYLCNEEDYLLLRSMGSQAISISYIYAEPVYWDRYEAARSATGWSKSALLAHSGHTFVEAYLDYYQKAAELDAKYRGFEQHEGEHYRLLSDWQSLPAYKESRPQFDPSPLERLPDPVVSLDRVSFTRFRCSSRDAACLHLAMIIERTNVQVLMTKILRWYYSNYWESNYLMQIESDAQATLNPTLTTQ